MAKVRMTCKCENCGKEFEHIHMCRNTKDAVDYEKWAKENITICPECYAEQKRMEKENKRKAYMEEIEEGHKLPEITGVSEKQIAYAERLRSLFIDDLATYNVNLKKFFQGASEIRFEKMTEKEHAMAAEAAEKVGKTTEEWFEERRNMVLARATNLGNPADVKKVETIFAESNAAKIIDALK